MLRYLKINLHINGRKENKVIIFDLNISTLIKLLNIHFKLFQTMFNVFKIYITIILDCDSFFSCALIRQLFWCSARFYCFKQLQIWINSWLVHFFCGLFDLLNCVSLNIVAELSFVEVRSCFNVKMSYLKSLSIRFDYRSYVIGNYYYFPVSNLLHKLTL